MSTGNLPAVRYAVGDIAEMAKNVSRSNLFGMNETQMFTLMLLAESKGLHPIQAVERYHVIQNRPAMKADAMLAEFQSKGGIVEWHQHDHVKCEATFFAPGVKTPTKVSWSIEDAKRAGLAGKEMYNKYPRQLLRARVISEGVRMTMPGIVCGIYTPEEVSDFDSPLQARATVVTEPEQTGPVLASTKDTRRFSERIKTYCDAVNTKWLDKNTDPDTGECAATELINVFQLTNHMLKEAGITFLDGGKHNDRMRAAAALWLADEARAAAGWKFYVAELVTKAKAATIEPEDESQEVPDEAELVAVGADVDAEELAQSGREPGCDDE